MNWALTRFNPDTERFELAPHVSIKEAERAFSMLSPVYIPKTVSKIARITSRGDADLISDLIAIQRYQKYEKQKRHAELITPKFCTPIPRRIEKLGVMEQVYLPKTFGQYIRRVRKKADLSQKAVTQRIGLAHSSVARYENDETFPTIAIISRFAPLAEAAGIRYADIKREYICAKYGPEEGTLGDIISRERWFAQMNVKNLASQTDLRTSTIRALEADKVELDWTLCLSLEKIAFVLSSNRIFELAKELRHNEFGKQAFKNKSL